MHTIKQAGLETALGPTLVKLLHGGDVAGRFLGTKVLPHLQAGGGLLRGAKGLASDVGQLGQKGLGMVTGKGMGSGLLPQPAKIREILETVLPQLGCKISVKLRSGLVSPGKSSLPSACRKSKNAENILPLII